MGNLTLNGATSGQITISPPAVAGTNTLTLPAATGTVALTANPTFTGTVTATTITSPAATNLTIQSAGTTAMTIDTSQNVGIGTTSTTGYWGSTSQSSKIVSASASSGTTLDTATKNLVLWNTDTTANNTTSLVFGTQNTGGTGISQAAIYSVNGTRTLAFNAGQLAFAYSNASGVLTEAMRIDSSGNLLVGYTSSNGSYKLQVNSQIFATSSTIATSDANYKTNVMPLSGALDIVQKLNPVSFSWKEHAVHNFDTATPTIGFLAQEVQTALSSQTYVNSIVKESEVTLPDETKEKFLGIAEGNMIALLTKAIQELKTTVDAQAAEITALKVKVGV